MSTLIEQRAAELVADRQQKALTAFEVVYQELLEPIRGSGLTYRVETDTAGLSLVFELTATGQAMGFLLHENGQLTSDQLTEITPALLTEVLADILVSWHKAKELWQWEQRSNLSRFIGQLWKPLGVLTVLLAAAFTGPNSNTANWLFLSFLTATIIAICCQLKYVEERQQYAHGIK